jgi:hypothetical protein
VTRPDPQEELEPPQGRVRLTGPGPLVTLGVIGLVVGWAVRPVCLQLRYAEPNISLVSVGLLFFAAAIIGGSAYLTRRTVLRDRFALAPHQAVNRLVLGKASALVGALLAGCYLGFALSHLGVGGPAADARLWRSALAGVGATLVTVAGLLLEHACRVPRPPE